VSSGRPIRCLLVDDHAGVRSAVARGLVASGLECRQAGSGVEAVELLEAKEPDVVISDIRMPEMDGVALLRHVRERHPDVAVIMVTGVDDVNTAVGCLQLGAYDYVVKPFQVEQLRARVLQAVERRRLVLENRRYHEHLAELVHQQALRIEELFLEGIQSIVHALEAKDLYTRGHSARVAAYATATARRLGLAEDMIQVIALGAELHDVGKIGVSEAVLNKPGHLTDDEYRHIMQHTVIGARILGPLLKHARPALEIIRSHHERLDGTGLPDGLAGDAIPLHARIVTVVDAFDAMTTGRAYRRGLAPEVALAELRANTGTQFDSPVVEAFIAAYPDPHSLPIPTPEATHRSLPQRLSSGVALIEDLA
jgi:response regulator RpfG family c-di-GMP phosphodiesterase